MPVPHPNPARSIRPRFVRALRLGAAVSIVIATGAVVLVARGETGLHASRLIAAALGIGLAILLGTAATMLLLLGRRGGHDAGAGAAPTESDRP